MRKSNNKGMSLVEILIATFIFTLALSALLSGVLGALLIIDSAKDQTIANTDLINMMERIKAAPFSSMLTLFPNGVEDGPAGNNYSTYVGVYRLNGEHITATYKDVNSDPLEIKVHLSWEGKLNRNYNSSLYTFKTR